MATTFDLRFEIFIAFATCVFLSLFSFPSTVYGVSAYYIERFVALLGTHTRRATARPERSRIHVHDGNRVNNVFRARRFFASDHTRINFDGFTMVGDYQYPFPAYADPSTILRFHEAFLRLPNFDQRQLLYFATVTPDVRMILLPLFVRVLSHRLSLVGHVLRFTDVCAFFGAFVITHFFGFESVVAGLAFMVLAQLVGRLWMNCGLGQFDQSPWYVASEELLNHVFGPWMTIFIETYSRRWSGRLVLIPMLLHLVLMFLPFPARIVIHFVWNRSVGSKLRASLTHVDLDTVEISCYIIGLVRLAHKKDVVGVALHLGTKASFFGAVVDTLSGSYTSGQLATLIVSGLSGSDNENVLLAEERNPLFDWLPDHVRKSPAFNKVAALTSLFFLSTWCRSSYVLSKVGDYIGFGDSDLGVVASVGGAVVACVKGFQRIVEEKDWWAFFDMPKDAKFLDAARALQTKSMISEEDAVAFISDAQRLVDSRLYSQNSPEVVSKIRDLERMVAEKSGAIFCLKAASFYRGSQATESDEVTIAKLAEASDLLKTRILLGTTSQVKSDVQKLEEWIELKSKNLARWAERVPAFPITLLGQPGTGKTVLLDLIPGVLRGAEHTSQRTGDKLFFEQANKYPIPSGAPQDANFLIVNDALQDYSESVKSGLEPLDFTWQKAVDSAPLTFNAAAIQDKSKIYSEIKAMIVSSNWTEYKTAFPCEKLERRLDSGMSVDVYCVDDKGKVSTFEQMTAMNQQVRNSSWRFRVLKARCNHRHLVFEPTQVVYNLAEFFEVLKRKYLKHLSEGREKMGKLGSKAPRCKCGVPYTAHKWVTDEVGEVGFKTLLDGVCEMPEDQGFDVLLGSVTRGELLAIFVFATFSWFFTAVVGVLLLASLLAGGAWIYRHRSWVKAQFMLTCREASAHAIEAAKEALASQDHLADRAFEAASYVSPSLAYKIKAYQMFCRVKRWVKEHSHLLVAGALLAMLGKVYLDHQSTPHSFAKPIYREQVDPGSMNFGPVEQEQSFPEVKLRAWGRTAQNFNKRTPFLPTKEGVQTDQLISLASAARVEAEIDFGPGKRRKVIFLQLSPEFVVGNRHFFRDEQDLIVSDKFTITVRGVVKNFEMSDVMGDGTTEAILMRFMFPNHAPGLLSYLTEDFVGQPIYVSSLNKGHDHPRAYAVPANVLLGQTTYETLRWPMSSEKGDCGNGVVGYVQEGSSALVGVVAYGTKSGHTGAALISRKWFERVTASVPVVVEHVVNLAIDMEIGELSPSSELRDNPSPYLEALGTMKGRKSTFVSKLRETVLSGSIKPLLSKDYIPPRNLRVVIDGQYRSAFKNTFKHVNLGCDITASEIDHVCKHMLDQMASLASLEEKKIAVRPLSLAQAFFGEPSLGVERIDFKTSVGAMLKQMGITEKSEMFKELEEEEQFALDERVGNLIERYLNMLRNGQAFTPTGQFVPKDELRARSKVEAAEIRLFCVMCAAYNLLVRMYLMPLIQYMLVNRELSECYGGMNAGSFEWDRLAKHLKGGGGRFFFDMDFSAFDASHGCEAFVASATFFHGLALRVGYTEQEAFIVYMIFISYIWQISIYDLDVFLKYKGMPSGVIFTLMMNSFMNSFLLRLAFKRLVGDLSEFSKMVTTGTVGDDNITSAIRAIIGTFNMVTIAVQYRRMGYVATPAKKGNETQAELPFEELTFLKRSFVLRSEFQDSYVAPIELDSIYKAFTYEQPSPHVTSAERLIGIAHSAQLEAALHGEAVFLDVQEKLHRAFSDHGLGFEKLIFSEIVADYVRGDFRTFML